jgi:hypothetical protein
MDNEQMEKQVARQSALIYLPVSLGMALAFLLAASVFGSYSLVAKIGGTFWVGLLSLIVSMPVVTARVKRKSKQFERYSG